MVLYIELIGTLAGVLTTAALVPQALKSWKTKHTRDVSLGWISTLNVGVFLWLVYGILISSIPLILANVFTLLLALIILFLKLKYDG
jgi:MtN3 and saliva related transmembrane protein|tara:strand:+ start:11513 stop:11773 length:261 start_codon:yes stop_codon:yes gene_type:complete